MTTPTTAATAAVPEDRSVRTGTVLVVAGIAAEYAVTQLHPSHEDPDDHHAVFPEYAASDGWIAVHLGQFAAGLLVLLGILTLLAGLRSAGAPRLVVRAGSAAAVVAAAVLAVLQAVDGVALKQAVDSLAAVPDHLRDAAFHDAEVVRWMEWAAAGYSRVTLGLTVALTGLAVLTSRALPRWSGAIAVLAGAAFVAEGVAVSSGGFSGTGLPGLVSWPLLVAFTVVTTAAAWRGPRRWGGPVAPTLDRGVGR